jgi:hypothetical protein
MSLEFIPADVLNSTYRVVGHFYDARLASGKLIPCRSLLEIIGFARGDSRRGQPDAVFIMMNPGCSRPLDSVPAVVSAKAISAAPKRLVATQPDTTQYQVMRVMSHLGLRHVRVINLSDLRETQSQRFVAIVESLERDDKFIGHSIFSLSRQPELEAALKRKRKAPLVCAWGVGNGLAPLIARCVEAVGSDNAAAGLLKPSTKDRYYHPLPKTQAAQRAWVEAMVNHLS